MKPLNLKPRLLREKDAAAYIGMSVYYLRNGRYNGALVHQTPPPRHIKLQRAIRYELAALDEWIDEQRAASK